MWEIKAVSTRETEAIRRTCTTDVPVTGKPGIYREQFDSETFVKKLICSSVVYPQLLNAELQDSYGVKTPEELIVEMVDNPGEYNDFAAYIQTFNDIESLSDKVEEAKN